MDHSDEEVLYKCTECLVWISQTSICYASQNIDVNGNQEPFIQTLCFRLHSFSTSQVYSYTEIRFYFKFKNHFKNCEKKKKNQPCLDVLGLRETFC